MLRNGTEGRKEYGDAVEEASTMTVKDIQSVVNSKEDAVAAVVLLDQLPRNMFRGMEAAKVPHYSGEVDGTNDRLIMSMTL